MSNRQKYRILGLLTLPLVLTTGGQVTPMNNGHNHTLTAFFMLSKPVKQYFSDFSR